jgi:hypothetical protein
LNKEYLSEVRKSIDKALPIMNAGKKKSNSDLPLNKNKDFVNVKIKPLTNPNIPGAILKQINEQAAPTT